MSSDDSISFPWLTHGADWSCAMDMGAGPDMTVIAICQQLPDGTVYVGSIPPKLGMALGLEVRGDRLVIQTEAGIPLIMLSGEAAKDRQLNWAK